jgi:hypothetical protein
MVLQNFEDLLRPPLCVSAGRSLGEVPYFAQAPRTFDVVWRQDGHHHHGLPQGFLDLACEVAVGLDVVYVAPEL